MMVMPLLSLLAFFLSLFLWLLLCLLPKSGTQNTCHGEGECCTNNAYYDYKLLCNFMLFSVTVLFPMDTISPMPIRAQVSENFGFIALTVLTPFNQILLSLGKTSVYSCILVSHVTYICSYCR